MVVSRLATPEVYTYIQSNTFKDKLLNTVSNATNTGKINEIHTFSELVWRNNKLNIQTE